MGAERKTAGGATPRKAQQIIIIEFHFTVPPEELKRAIVFLASHRLISATIAGWLINVLGLRGV